MNHSLNLNTVVDRDRISSVEERGGKGGGSQIMNHSLILNTVMDLDRRYSLEVQGGKRGTQNHCHILKCITHYDCELLITDCNDGSRLRCRHPNNGPPVCF